MSEVFGFKKPFFSIIIPTYNRFSLLREAIQSVMDQRYENWELIIVDDGSTDQTSEVVAKYYDSRIRYIYQENQGESVARNKGIDQAEGDYICFLDDDDLYLPEFLTDFEEVIRNSQETIPVLCCEQSEILLDGDISEPKKHKKQEEHALKFYLTYGNNLQPFCIEKRLLDKNRFDPKFLLGEDFHLLVRLLMQYDLYYIPRSNCLYRNHRNMSQNEEYTFLHFSNLKYDRLDTFEDLLERYRENMKLIGILNLFLMKFNQICYFYSSTYLKNKAYSKSLKTLSRMKVKGGLVQWLYYQFSIRIRLLILRIKQYVLLK